MQDHASRPPRLWRRRAWRRALSQVHGIAFCSRRQAEPFLSAGVIDARSQLYEIPESTSRFEPGDRVAARRATGLRGEPCVLWVGHLDENKDPLTVLAGIAHALPLLPRLRLYCCYGQAPLMRAVRRHAQHSGDDVTAWRDRRRVFEKLLCTEVGVRQGPRLRELRARMAAGLARSEANFERRTDALSTLASSAPYCWRHPHWWLEAPGTLLRTLLPAAMRRRLGAWRRRHRHARPAPTSPTTGLSPS